MYTPKKFSTSTTILEQCKQPRCGGYVPNRCAASYKVLVVSSQFEGKPLLQRHRLVNTCLAEELKEIHAFEQKTLTPEQWEKQKAQ
ncbi:hypothetical protein F7725_004235 [Dissostichus mawsoni]|uniref:BolA-like protein 2 n=1 Tax=Dissostichus mawsoni TaxID=36200 RepID=A0A7J5XIL2_DISMA|nr:hypothetical protein F7725_004235 [Dissostichus mawsoni]